MKPLRSRLEDARNKTGIQWGVLERDYSLSWILAGLMQTDRLKDTLVFKGGTALKKCYFGDYRFSEDLDFSTTGSIPNEKAMDALIDDACKSSMKLLNEYAPVQIAWERYTERDPHPTSQQTFKLRFQFPWQRAVSTSVYIEIASDEPIVKPIQRLAVLHEYGEPFSTTIQAYSLEEIVLEKLRGTLQTAKRIKERGWARSRARDYYDLWRILKAYRSKLDVKDFRKLLKQKCAIRQVDFENHESFFQDIVLQTVKRDWGKSLGQLVTDLPPYEKVIEELRSGVQDLVQLPKDAEQ